MNSCKKRYSDAENKIINNFFADHLRLNSFGKSIPPMFKDMELLRDILLEDFPRRPRTVDALLARFYLYVDAQESTKSETDEKNYVIEFKGDVSTVEGGFEIEIVDDILTILNSSFIVELIKDKIKISKRLK